MDYNANMQFSEAALLYVICSMVTRTLGLCGIASQTDFTWRLYSDENDTYILIWNEHSERAITRFQNVVSRNDITTD